jgi:hypothetical protein
MATHSIQIRVVGAYPFVQTTPTRVDVRVGDTVHWFTEWELPAASAYRVEVEFNQATPFTVSHAAFQADRGLSLDVTAGPHRTPGAQFDDYKYLVRVPALGPQFEEDPWIRVWW